MGKVVVPLVRRKDRKPIGTLTLIRTKHVEFYDREGRRHAIPRPIDALVAVIHNPDGEEVTWNVVNMDALEAEMPAESVDPDDDAAFIAELQGEVTGQRD